MKRLFLILFCLRFLCLPVNATPSDQLIALTFDDGPSGRFTRQLLDGLAQREVQATFFLCGYRMEQYPELAQRIFQEGHEIGLHGYSHKAMQNMNSAEIAQELKATKALLPAGCTARFLRCPGGTCNEITQNVAASMGLSLIYWSVDPRDWATDDAVAIENDILCHAQDGDIILLHDMSTSSVQAALSVVDKLSAKGFRFVTVSQLVNARDLSPVPGSVYSCFR